jgi:exosome complex RNA-binding protein Rrp4|tara:strand:- start:426 stop:668 length:243 start_codon:yes stop_codon:yes gene_type:complete
MEDIYFEGKLVIIKVHAIKRARQREIAFPDQVYNVLQTGKVSRFGKNHLKFVKKGKQGSIICIGEDLGHTIIIKTIERGN